MQAASGYFKKGYYENAVFGVVASDGGSLKVGIKSTSMPSSYWVIFDNFRLLFYGDIDSETIVTGIQTPVLSQSPASQYIYTLDGRRISGDTQLRPGIYVKNGKKIIVK